MKALSSGGKGNVPNFAVPSGNPKWRALVSTSYLLF